MLRNRRAIGSRGVGQLHALRQHAGLQIEIRPRAVELQPSEPDGLPQDASGYVAEYHLRVAQAVGRDFPRLRKKQPVFVFHWRGGGLNRQILSELLALAGTLAQARGKQASCSVNVPQAVIQLQFSDAPEPDITIQQANEGEAAPETQTVSE